ncbi:4'-phosphopantetheinyl transferase superfamily protein [bacterium]|nr:4'-phosphopantetheinyl transferase superfamily protein [candidate division CSSED10-310 bacterium]
MSLSLHPFPLNVNDTEVAACLDALTDEERVRGKRLRRRDVARRFIVARCGLRRVLAEYTGLSPETIRFRVLPYGKPIIDPDQNPCQVSFNLSHSHELGLVGICWKNDMGVDVEYIDGDRNIMEIASRYFTPEEVVRLNSMDAGPRLIEFYRIWTLKESWLKATGLGIAGLGLVATARRDREILTIVEWCRDGSDEEKTYRPMDWRLFQPAPGYIAAYTRLYSSQIVSMT